MVQKDILLRLIIENCYNSGIEIGTLHGDTARHILDGRPQLKLISIDPNPDPEIGELMAPYVGRFQLIKKTSDTAIAEFDNHQCYFVWIDGDHQFWQVRRDILNYWPLVVIGGMIGGHDYGHGGDVRQVVNSIFKNAFNTDKDGVWWVKKKHAEI